MELPSDLQERVMLRPGVVVCYTNAVGFRSFGIIVSEVNGTLEVAYPSWKRLRVVIEPLANFGPVEKIGVPVGADLQPKDLAQTVRRALAMKDQKLSLLTDRAEDFVSLCVHGHREPHYTEKLARATGRLVLAGRVAAVTAQVAAAIGQARKKRRR